MRRSAVLVELVSLRAALPTFRSGVVLVNYVVRNIHITEHGNHHVYGRIVEVLHDAGWQSDGDGGLARLLLCLIETGE